MIEFLVFVAAVGFIWWLHRTFALLSSRRTTSRLRLFRARRIPRGERCHLTLFDHSRQLDINPVRQAELSTHGISLWVAEGIPFKRAALFIPWSAITDSYVDPHDVHLPGEMKLGADLELWLDWYAAEIIRELGIALPCSDNDA